MGEDSPNTAIEMKRKEGRQSQSGRSNSHVIALLSTNENSYSLDMKNELPLTRQKMNECMEIEQKGVLSQDSLTVHT